MEDETFGTTDNLTANLINNLEMDEKSTPKKETEPPPKPIVVAELLLYDSKDRAYDYLVTHNHILINRACADRTKKKFKRPIYFDNTTGEEMKCNMFECEGQIKYHGPRKGVSRQQFAATLFDVRNTIRKVNLQMRFPYRNCDLSALQVEYNRACRLFFKAEFDRAQETYPALYVTDLYKLLALKFFDVSYLVNKQTPVAAPVPAEACIIARKNMKEMNYFDIQDEPEAQMDATGYIKQRFKPYNGVDDLPHRREQRKSKKHGLAEYDFYLKWEPTEKDPVINKGVCKRFWEARRMRTHEENEDSNEEAVDYKDERIDKCEPYLDSTDLTTLSTLLYSSAIDFEYTLFTKWEDKFETQPLLQYDCVQAVFNDASRWFGCFVSLPYDATFRLDALLDCVEFFMGHRYGKFQLPDVYKIEVLQIGFGFINRVGRKQWVYTIESLLYTFNLQCKFMMPCKHKLNKLLTLNYFSNMRGLSAGVVFANNDATELPIAKLDKIGLQVLLRYFSMPTSIDIQFHGQKVSDRPTVLDHGTLFFWQNALSDFRKNYFTHSIKPIDLPIKTLESGEAPYEEEDLALTVHAQHLRDFEGQDNIYPFVLSINQDKVRFSILTRYLIFNKVSGYHHLFQFQQFQETPEDKLTSYFFTSLSKHPKVRRGDIHLYLHWYFRYALRVLGDPRHVTELTPIEMLKQMHKFWHLTFDSQDTVAICLEVQQLYLYRHLKHGLIQWFAKLPTLAPLQSKSSNVNADHYNHLRTLRITILYGARYNTNDSEKDRAFFIDMIARRLLFWCCIQQFRESYSAEVSIYAGLPNWQEPDEVKIDCFSGVTFGNIDIDNMKPLTAKALEKLQSSEHMKKHQFTNCHFWLSNYVSIKSKMNEAVKKQQALETKFGASGDVQCYRKEQLLDKSITYDEMILKEAAQSKKLEQLAETIKASEKLTQELQKVLVEKHSKFKSTFPDSKLSFELHEICLPTLPPNFPTVGNQEDVTMETAVIDAQMPIETPKETTTAPANTGDCQMQEVNKKEKTVKEMAEEAAAILLNDCITIGGPYDDLLRYFEHSLIGDDRLDQFWRLRVYGMELFKMYGQSGLTKKQIYKLAWEVFEKFVSKLDGDALGKLMLVLSQGPPNIPKQEPDVDMSVVDTTKTGRQL